jgi:hypothetical protein
LHTEGLHLIEQDTVFDLFPAIGMPGHQKGAEPKGASHPPPLKPHDKKD